MNSFSLKLWTCDTHKFIYSIIWVCGHLGYVSRHIQACRGIQPSDQQMWISRQLASQLEQGQIAPDFRRNKERKKRNNGKENKKKLLRAAIFTKAMFRMLVLRSVLFGLVKMQFSRGWAIVELRRDPDGLPIPHHYRFCRPAWCAAWATTMLRSPSGTQFPLVSAFELRAVVFPRAKLPLVGVGRDLAAVRRTTWACVATGKAAMSQKPKP